ncbi:MAG: MFS transporter, partial [Deltaproteobacteria bacterium]|nr:MFS transporter [Deltaproteobacteria bacterium]
MTPTSTPAASTAPPSGSALLEEEARQHPYWKSNSYALLVGNLSNTLGFSIFYPYFPLMVREMGVEQNLDSVVGYLAGMYFLVSFLSGPVWGGLADHYGRRSMILRAGFGMGVGFTLSALMPSLTWFVLVFAVVGLANGYVPSGMGLIATNTPRRHLGWALSLAQSGTLIGTTVGPLVGAVLSGLMPTYRDLFFIAGGFSTLAGLVALFWVKERHTRPTEPFRLSILADSRVILRQPGMGVLMVLHTVFNLIYFGSTPVIALFVLSMAGGAPVIDGLRVETWMGLATLALTVASIAAMPLWGRALDRWEPGRVMAIGLGLSALSMLPLL